MKKYIISFVAMLVVISVVSLTAKSAQAQTTSTGFCYTFTTNLGVGRGISTQDASALAAALTSEGFWTSGTPITTFNDNVASAVSGFQQKYATQVLTPSGLSYGTGYVGPATRAELNTLYGCSATLGISANNTSQYTSNVTANNAGFNYGYSGYHRPPSTCPAGFTCTPLNQPPVTSVCPPGYTCNPTYPIIPTYFPQTSVTQTPSVVNGWSILPFYKDSDWPSSKGSSAIVNGNDVLLQGQPARSVAVHSLPTTIDYDVSLESRSANDGSLDFFLIPTGLSTDVYPSQMTDMRFDYSNTGDYGSSDGFDIVQKGGQNQTAVTTRLNSIAFQAGVTYHVHMTIDINGYVQLSINNQPQTLASGFRIPYSQFQIQIMSWQPTNRWHVSNVVVTP